MAESLVENWRLLRHAIYDKQASSDNRHKSMEIGASSYLIQNVHVDIMSALKRRTRSLVGIFFRYQLNVNVRLSICKDMLYVVCVFASASVIDFCFEYR
jgi:hypothetical protein